MGLTPTYEVFVAWTSTGEVIDQLVVTDWSYQESVSWSDLGKATLVAPLTGPQGRINRSILKAMNREMYGLSAVIAVDGRALWAGPVATVGWSHMEATVGCATLGKLFDSRILVTDTPEGGYWGGPLLPGADLHFDLSSHDLAIQLLWQGSTGFRRGLPLILPAQLGTGGEHVDYEGGDLRTVYETIKEVSNRAVPGGGDDGPDVLLVPELYDGGDMLRWVARVGNPDLGTAGSWSSEGLYPAWDWPVSITKLDGDSDGTEMVSTGYVLGDTPEGAAQRLLGVAVWDRGAGVPAFERADRTSVSGRRQEQLDALAWSYVGINWWPTHVWNVTVHPEHTPIIGVDWTLGDACRIVVDDSHGWLDPGEYTRRILGVTHTRRELILSTTDGSEVGMPRWTG